MNTGAADQTARSGIEGTGKAACEDLIYEPNPKHKEPWQRGARGSLCPRDADGPALLAISLVDPQHPGKRYATDGSRAYCGQEHLTGRWHGYPVQWREVPSAIRSALVNDYRVSKRDLKEHW
jgi:hypothetical protein